MVPLPNSESVTSDAESDEADPTPCPSDSDDESEDSLAGLLSDLAGPPAKRLRIAGPDVQSLAIGPADWAVEVKSAVVTFLPWRELPGVARISQSWRSLEQSETLWKEYFRIQWPRLFCRKAASHPQGAVGWRVLFRQRWAEPNHNEDDEEEHWNDFSAALDIWKTSGTQKKMPLETPEKTLPEHQQIEHAVDRFKEDHLRLRSICIPACPVEKGTSEHCAQKHGKCRHRVVPIAGKLDGCLFVCERCADVHVCRRDEPCDGAVLTSANEFLVCTVSGRCFDPSRHCWAEDPAEAVATHDWDPDLSAAQQHGRWFEQGYFMDEDQADEFFDGGSGRKQRQRLRCRASGSGSGGGEGLAECQQCC